MSDPQPCVDKAGPWALALSAIATLMGQNQAPAASEGVLATITDQNKVDLSGGAVDLTKSDKDGEKPPSRRGRGRPTKRPLEEPRAAEPTRAPAGHYDVLRLSRVATAAEVRSAYRKGALATHPDKGGDPEDFRRVVAAFEILSDQQKRADYDKMLKKTASRDGLGGQSQRAEKTTGTGNEEHLKIQKVQRGRARLLQQQLYAKMDAKSDAWMSELDAASTELLVALGQLLAMRRKIRASKQACQEGEVDVAAREIAPPSGLPEGWKCIEHTYKSGASKGKTYTRFTSPWGQKHLMSVKAAVQLDAEHKGEDGAAAVKAYEESCRAAKAKAKANSRPKQSERLTTQQKSVYACHAPNGTVRYFVQVGWSHFVVRTGRTLSLAEAIDWHIALTQTVAAASARLRGTSAAAPLTPAEERQLLQNEPTICLFYTTVLSTGRGGSLSGANSRDLRLAVRQYNALRSSQRSGASHEQLTALRDKFQKELVQREKILEQMERQLYKAIQCRLRDRGLDPKSLLPHQGEAGGHIDVAASGAVRGANGASSSDGAAFIPSTDQQELATSPKAGDPPAAALQDALGLNQRAAKRLANQLRALPKAELKRRLRVLQGTSKGPEDGPPRKKSKATKAIAGSQVLSLTSPTDGSTRPEAFIMPEPYAAIFGLACGDAARCFLTWLGFADHCSLRETSRSAAAVVRYETWLRCRRFAYMPSQFEPRCQRSTRSGRVLPMPPDAVCRRLVNFLSQPQHASFIESLDLQQAPISALQSSEMHHAVRTAMPRLTSVLLPSEGWSTPYDRQRFLSFLGGFVAVNWAGPGRARSDSTPKRTKKDPESPGNQLQVCDAPTASMASAELVGLADLIPNWAKISDKDRRDLHSRLRDAVAEGRLPARKGQKWEWDCCDPALAVVREVFVAAGLM